jgi:hypothetical protein
VTYVTVEETRPLRSLRHRVVFGLLAVGALLVAGCGGGDPTGAGSAATADQGGAPLADEATSSLLLTKVVDGSEVALGDAVASDRPTLLWFWAPH